MKKKIKRIPAIAIVLAMCISALAIQAFAEENISIQTSKIQSRIDAVLVQYGITVKMTDNEIADAISTADGDTLKATTEEIAAIEEAALSLTEEALEELDTDLYGRFCDVLERVTTPTTITTQKVLNGQVSVTDTANSNNLSDGVVTIQAKGSLFSKKTNTITITNNADSKAKLSFDYTASTYSSFTIAGANASASGNYSILLDAGASVTLVLVSNSGVSNTTATLTLSNFSLTVAAESSKVTIVFDSTLGSVTAAGSGASSGAEYDVTLTDGIALTATANSNVTFLGWINESTKEKVDFSGTYYPAEAITLRAVFASASTEAWFVVDNKYLTNDLNTAGTLGATIVLANDGTLAEGDYTIASNDTLLIPYDSSNTVITDTPITHACGETYTTPTVYRTLTMADGAHITVAGSMSVAATTAAPGAGYHYPNGGACGPVARVAMNAGSSITVNGGLYCYGYITGSGTITAENGAVVYERFEIADYRGGDASSSMNDDSETYEVFPMSQYYIQNIEVPLTLKCGAKEYAWTAITLSVGLKTSKVDMIGNDNTFMFGLTSGSVTKRYDPATDRQIYDVNGIMTLNNISIVMDAGLLGTVTIDSAGFMLPITSSMTINIHSGTATVNQALALLPEAQLSIDSGAKVVLEKDVHVYDLDQWGAYIYENATTPTAKMRQARWRPDGMATRTLANDASIVVNGELVATGGKLYTTSSGASITSAGTGKITMTAGTDTIAYQASKQTKTTFGYDVTYSEISITSAKLKNADGNYVNTADATYNYINGVWYDAAVCKRLDIVATNIAVNDGLDVYFYVDKADMANGVDYTAVVTKSFAGKREDSVKTITPFDWSTRTISDSVTYMYFTFEDISAKEMTDAIEVRIYQNYGKENQMQVNNTFTETVQNYAIRTFADIADDHTELNDLLRTALADMLYYGAAAQEFFGYNKNNLATDTPDNISDKYTDVLDNNLGYATEDVKALENQLAEDFNFAGATVSATNTLMFTFYFNISDPTGMTATITYTDHYENEQTRSVPAENFYARIPGQLYGVDVLDMSIVDGRQLITCEVYKGDTLVASATDSVEGYAARKSNGEDDIFEQMMKFVDSACAYFDELNNS